MHRLLILLLAATALQGCGGEPASGTFDPNQPATGPLTALGECDGPPGEAMDDVVVEGAVLHPDAVVVDLLEQEALTNLTVYIPHTPVNIRLWYENAPDLEIIVIEDEIHEAELLVSNGTHRTYVKAGAVCQTGSLANMVVAAELAESDTAVPPGSFTGGG